MKKIIQIRGTNATGKTTAVRRFISGGEFRVFQISVLGNEYCYTYDGQRRIAVAGRYDERECGGVDGYIKDKRVLKEYLIKLLKTLEPETLILDAVMYGVTFRFGYELAKVGERLGYHYVGLVFAPPLDWSLMRLYERNGGKEINVDHLQRKHFQSIRAYEMSKAAGMDMRLIDTSKIPREQMQRLVEEVL